MGKSERQKKVAALDALWGKIVRKRDRDTCQSCRRPGDNPHHVFSRRHLGTRWDVDNGITLCWACHKNKAHGDPLLFGEWIRERWGGVKYDKMRLRATAVTKIDLVMVGIVLKRQWDDLERMDGREVQRTMMEVASGSLFRGSP